MSQNNCVNPSLANDNYLLYEDRDQRTNSDPCSLTILITFVSCVIDLCNTSL